MKQHKVYDFFYRILCGAFLGFSIILPGISGSIMAVMLGIFDRLINIVSNPFKDFKKNVIYLFPMGIGGLLSIFISIKALNQLFDTHPVPAFLLFMSLIAGGMPTVYKEARTDRFKNHYWIGMIAAFAIALTAGFFANRDVSTLVDTSHTSFAIQLITLSVSGLIAGVSSIVPGMSVSMILMMLGTYELLLRAASNINLVVIIPVGIFFVIGMVLFSKLIKWVFHHYHDFSYFMVLGFMGGSLVSIFPGLPQNTTDFFLSVLGIAAGVAVAVLFTRLGKRYHADDLDVL